MLVMQIISQPYCLVTLIYQQLKIDMCRLVPGYICSGSDGGDIWTVTSYAFWVVI
jgi:hypothetical protein